MPIPSTPSCPFGHGPATIIESVAANELAAAYRDEYEIEIGPDLRGVSTIAFCECTVCALKFFFPATPGSEELYARLSLIPWYYSPNKEEFISAARRVPSGARVIEIGCGSGHFASHIPGRDYTGIELNRTAVAQAKERGLNVLHEDLADFASRAPAAFDVVCAFQVLEHVPDPAAFLTACCQLAKPGGILMFGVPNADSYLGVQPDEILNMPPHHMSWWPSETFWRIALTFGMEVVATEALLLSGGCREQFKRGVVMRAISRRIGRNSLFCFTGRRYRVLKRIAALVSPIVLMGVYDPHHLPRGHTMLAILRKL